MTNALQSEPNPGTFDADLRLLRVARELAVGIRPLDEILELHEIDPDDWEAFKSTPQFTKLLSEEIAAWESASNTRERVRLKSLAFLEEALPEYFGRAHDRREPLSAKIELLKAIAKIAGIDGGPKDADPGQKFSVVINLGSTGKLTFEERRPAITVEAEEEE